MINNVTLVGRIANEPEKTFAQGSGMVITKFRLAVGRGKKGEDGKEETDWLNIVCFQKVAEFVGQYLDKGSLVAVCGRIQSRTWEGNDGKRNYMVEILANVVNAVESKREADWRRENKAQRDSGDGGGYGGGAPAGGAPQGAPAQGDGFGEGPLGENEDPFGDD